MKEKAFYGVGLYNKSKNELLEEIKKAVDEDHKVEIMSINPEILMYATQNKKVHRVLSEAKFNIPDGIGAILLAKRQKIEVCERIAGYDLFTELLNLAEKEEKKVYLYGGSEKVNALAEQKAREKHPKLTIAGATNGYRKDKAEIVKEINESGADFLFIAMGAPRQELFIDEFKNELNVALIQPVEEAFDVLSGQVKRAPKWIQKIHMEWFYRMVTDLKRAGRVIRMLGFVAKEMRKGKTKSE